MGRLDMTPPSPSFGCVSSWRRRGPDTFLGSTGGGKLGTCLGQEATMQARPRPGRGRDIAGRCDHGDARRGCHSCPRWSEALCAALDRRRPRARVADRPARRAPCRRPGSGLRGAEVRAEPPHPGPAGAARRRPPGPPGRPARGADGRRATSGRTTACVFAQPNGRPIDRKADWRAWRALLTAAGVRTVRLHDGRHTAATLLLSAGVHPRVVMELLGHSQMRTTTDVYSHVMPALAREAADPMGAALWGSP